MEVSTEMQGEIAALRALDSVAHTGNGGNAGEDAATFAPKPSPVFTAVAVLTLALTMQRGKRF